MVFKPKDMLLLFIQSYHLNLIGHQKFYKALSSDASNQFSPAINGYLLQALPVARMHLKKFNNQNKRLLVSHCYLKEY